MAVTKAPDLVFRNLSPFIGEEIRNMANRAARHFQPRNLEVKDVISLCVRENHIQTLRDAWRMSENRISPHHRESAFAALQSEEGYFKDIVLYFNIPGDSPDMILLPDYATDTSRVMPIDTAPLEFTTNLKDQITQWLDLCARMTVVQAAFDYLNNMYPQRSREEIRYVFPAIVPLLRRVSENGPNEKIRAQALKWTAKLALSSPHHNWTVPLEYREGLRSATETVAIASLYENKRFSTADHFATMYLTQRKPVLTPYWPDEVNLLGLNP